MIFKRGRRYGLPEEKQALIYWTLQNYSGLAPGQKRYIDRLITEVAGERADILKDALTSRDPMQGTAMRCYADVSTVARLVGVFYRSFDFSVYKKLGR